MLPPPPMGMGMGMPMPPPPMGMPPAMPGMGMGMPPGLAGPMGMPPAMPPMDPFSIAAPPNPLMMLLMNPELLAQLTKSKELPRHRAKWQEPKKPTEGQMLTKARQDQTRLAALNRRFDDNLARIRMEAVGVFEDYDEDAETTWRSSALADEDQLIAALVGTIPPAFESPKRRGADADESQAKEDFLAFLHEDFRRQHQRRGYADLDMDVVKTVTRYGRVCSSTICRFDAQPGQAPFIRRLIDPATIYPTFAGDRGMTHATLIYWQRIADTIGDHDHDGKIEKRLMGGMTKNGRTGKYYEWDDEVEVIEYWDCKWMALYVGGELVKGPIAHDYGEPPFVYTLAPYGDPGYTRTPEQRTSIDQMGVSVTPLDADLARRGLSHFHTRFSTHAQREAMFGRLATKMRDWLNEPIWFEVDAMQQGLPRPKWSRAAGARNEIPEGIRLVPGPDAPVPPTLGPLMAVSNEDVSRSGLSPAEYGLTPSAQQSGYAIAGLSENGRNKLAPVRATVEAHHTASGEQLLRMYRDFGHLLGDEGSRGSYAFPKQAPTNQPNAELMWEVTPEMIDRTGTQVRCSLIETPDISSLGAMANSFGLLKQQGAISRRETIRLMGLPGSRNPDQTMREVDIEGLKEMPEYKLGQLLQYVMEEENNPGLAQFIMAQIVKGKQKEQAAATMAGMGGPPGGMPPGGPGGPANAPGLSLPGLGMPPGTQGGRPPGRGGPPPGYLSQGPPSEP